jgi:hypothetical protein
MVVVLVTSLYNSHYFMQNIRYIQCDDSCNIKMYSDAIFINELNNCKLLYFLSYIILVTKTVIWLGGM